MCRARERGFVLPRFLRHRILSDAENSDFDGIWRHLEVIGEDALPCVFQQKRLQNGENP